MIEPTFFEVHDEVTNKTLNIKANDLEQAEGIADTIPYEEYEDGAEIDVLDDIENYNSLPDNK
mgnify:CR=1 FL=1